MGAESIRGWKITFPDNYKLLRVAGSQASANVVGAREGKEIS